MLLPRIYCDRSANQVDHIHPRSRGGTDLAPKGRPMRLRSYLPVVPVGLQWRL